MKNATYEHRVSNFSVIISSALTALPHLHKEIELIYVKEGSAIAYADKNSYKLKKGDLFLSFPNQIHYYTNSVGEFLISIFNSSILFEMKEFMYNHIPKDNVVSLRGTPLENMMNDVAEISGKYQNTIKGGLINQIFGLIMPQFRFDPQIKTDNSTLKHILSYCEENFSSDISLDTLSEVLHLNKYHISHLINEKLGMNFRDYINTLRINEACDLISETDKKITEISEEVGFGSIRSFNRAFIKTFKKTPLEYRNDIKILRNSD